MTIGEIRPTDDNTVELIETHQSLETPLDEALLETGDAAQQAFDRIPEAEPPKPVEQILYDNIFAPKEDLEDEGNRLSAFRTTIGKRLTLLGVNENTIDAVTLGADELITNTKRYAWGGDIFISFIQNGDILVEVKGAEAHPPQLPASHREEVIIEDEFSESLDLSEFGIDMNAIHEEMMANLDEGDAALDGLRAIMTDESAEHGRGLNIVRAQSHDMGRYRAPDVEVPAEDVPWSMWFTVSDSNHSFHSV